MASDPPHPDPADRNVLDPDCERCPALVASRTRIAWGNGPIDADVLVVGEAPGAGDPEAEPWQGGNQTGLAYTSRHSGRRIRSLLADVGYADRAYYTNAVKCFPSAAIPADAPADHDVDEEAARAASNREPADAELRRCRDHLETELRQVDPAVVVPTGAHATRTLLAFEGREVSSFLDLVLERVDCPTLGVVAVPVLHPSYQEVWLSRLGYSRDAYRADLAAALDELVG